MNGAAEDKDACRALARKKASEIEALLRVEMSVRIQLRVLELPEFRAYDSIMLYAPYGTEVITDILIDSAFKSGKKVYLPVSTGTGYAPGEYIQGSVLAKGRYGILEPDGGAAVSLPDRILVVVPGLAFDRKCHRLGKGGGYYDRMLPEIKKAGTSCFCAGVVFSVNLYPSIPFEPGDFNVDLVVTESETIRGES